MVGIGDQMGRVHLHQFFLGRFTQAADAYLPCAHYCWCDSKIPGFNGCVGDFVDNSIELGHDIEIVSSIIDFAVSLIYSEDLFIAYFVLHTTNSR